MDGWADGRMDGWAILRFDLGIKSHSCHSKKSLNRPLYICPSAFREWNTGYREIGQENYQSDVTKSDCTKCQFDCAMDGWTDGQMDRWAILRFDLGIKSHSCHSKKSLNRPLYICPSAFRAWNTGYREIGQENYQSDVAKSNCTKCQFDCAMDGWTDRQFYDLILE